LDRKFVEQEMIMDRDRERETEDEEAPASGGDTVREKLKLAAHYALLAFAPVVSIVALIVALVASGNHSEQAQLAEVNVRIDKLEASLQASRAEVENLKFVMSREKTLRGDERKKDEELDEKIVQTVSRLQAKLKVAPTLEEQLRMAVSAPAAASSVQSAVPVPAAAPAQIVAPAPASTSAKPSVSAPKAEEKKTPTTAPAKKIEEKKKAPAAPAQKSGEKTSPKVKAIKDAIDQYNRQ
jgi:hypothetical protein